MMKRSLSLMVASFFVASLAGCGVDGEPTPPPPKPATKTGIRVSGDARFGVSISRGALPFYSVETEGYADEG